MIIKKNGKVTLEDARHKRNRREKEKKDGYKEAQGEETEIIWVTQDTRTRDTDIHSVSIGILV